MEGPNGIVGKWSRRLTYVQHHEICTKVLRHAGLADLALCQGRNKKTVCHFVYMCSVWLQNCTGATDTYHANLKTALHGYGWL